MKYLETKSKWCDTLKHNYIDNDGDILTIVLPGYGYSCDRPLLYYITGIALELNYDVLQIKYGFSQAQVECDDLSDLELEIIDVLNQLKKHYKKIIVVGKSIGTGFIPLVANHLNSTICKLIYLTPLDRTIPAVLTENMLMVYGEADRQLSKESRKRIVDSECSTIEANYANHGLETGDVLDSLDTMTKLMRAIKLYMLCDEDH